MNSNTKNKYTIDKDKLELSLLDWEFIVEMLKVLKFGAIKYGVNDWLDRDPEESVNAIGRHLGEFMVGNIIDGDNPLFTNINHDPSHLHQMAHIAVRAMFVYRQTKNININLKSKEILEWKVQ